MIRVVGWIYVKKEGGRLDIMKREGGRLDINIILGGRLDICRNCYYGVQGVTL